MLQVGTGVGAFEYVQAKVTLDATLAVIVDGVAVNVAIAGGVPLATNSVRWRLPAEFVHVSVYVRPPAWVTGMT